MHYLSVEPLTKESFAPFGDVIEYRDEPLNNNQGRCKKYSALATINTGHSGAIHTHLFLQSEAIQFPYYLQVFERHPIGCQMFMPLNKEPYLVVVTTGYKAPEPEGIRCFLVKDGQGVVYAPGVWHHPLLAMCDNAQFLVADPANAGTNLEEVFFSKEQKYCIRNIR